MPGGHIDPGETPDHAARRELFEETGIRVPISALKLVRVENRRKGNYYFYRVDLDMKPPVTLSFEHDKYMWVDETKHNPEWLKKYLAGRDTSKMTSEQKAKAAAVEGATVVGTRVAFKAGQKALAKRAAAKTAATVGAKVAAKQGIKAAGAGVPIAGWAVTGALMTYDAAPEAWAVGKEGIAKGKQALSEVRAAKGLKAKAKAVGHGYVEGMKHGVAGVARVGAASVVGSDVVKMGREAYSEKQMKKNGAADAAGKAAFAVGRRVARKVGAKAAGKVTGDSIARMARGATVGVLAMTGLAKVAAQEGVEIKRILKEGKKNPADVAANVAEINSMLKDMPPDWQAQLGSNRSKLRAAGAASGEIPPAKPNAHTVLRALNLNNRGDVSSEAAAGQEQPGGNPVPDDVREAAMEGIRASFANDYGGYDFIGVARAIQLAISPSISDAALNRMRMYFDRKTKQDRLSPQYKQKRGRRYMSWMNWGGDPGAIWSKSRRYRELVGSGNPLRNPSPNYSFAFLPHPTLSVHADSNWDQVASMIRRKLGPLYDVSGGMNTYGQYTKEYPVEIVKIVDFGRNLIQVTVPRAAGGSLTGSDVQYFQYTTGNRWLDKARELVERELSQDGVFRQPSASATRRNPNRGIGVEQVLADVYGEEWANWDLNRAGIMHYSPKGIPTSRSIVKSNPIAFKPEAFDQRLRRMGMTGHTIYREADGEVVKQPKMIMFDSPDAALQALAVFLVLENIETRGADPVEMTPRHAAVRLRDGRVYEANLQADGKALYVGLVGGKSRVDWFHWARLGDYPALASSR